MADSSVMHDPSAALPLFVYGSLLEDAQRSEIIGRTVRTSPAILRGFARARTRHWYLRPRAGAATTGLLLFDLSAAELAALDRYEELPTLYRREIVAVEGPGGVALRAWVYLPTRWAPAAE